MSKNQKKTPVRGDHQPKAGSKSNPRKPEVKAMSYRDESTMKWVAEQMEFNTGGVFNHRLEQRIIQMNKRHLLPMCRDLENTFRLEQEETKRRNNEDFQEAMLADKHDLEVLTQAGKKVMATWK